MTRHEKQFCGWIAALGLTLTASASAPVATPLGSHRELLHSPARLATDAAGNVFVTEPELGQVIKFDAFGRAAVVKEGLAAPLAIAVNNSGNIYLGDEKSGSVSVFDSQWQLLSKLGRGDGEFGLPNYIAVDPTPGSGAVYVSDSSANQIKVYTNGALAFAFGSPGTNTGQFNFPTGFFVTTSGEIFVVDQNNNRVQVFDLNGGFLRQFNAITTSGSVLGGSAGGKCQGITGDSSNRVYVADTLQGLVNVFDAQGVLLVKLGGFGETPGRLRSPASLAIATGNRLVISSVNNGRLELIGLDSYLHLTVAPAREIVGVGTNVTFSATAAGSGPLTYQWRKDALDLTDAGNISGATNAALSLTGVVTNNAGNYSVVVSSPSGSFTSSVAPLTVLAPPSLISQPNSLTVALGSTVNFSVEAEGDSLVYQWQFRGVNIPGATGSTFQITNAQPSQTGSYTVLVSNVVGSVMSAEAMLTVLIPPSIAVPPSGWTVIFGADLSFQVTAGGDALAFQWLFSDAPIPGATTDTLTLTNVSQLDAGHYSVIISNPVGSVTSSIAFLGVITSPVITSLSPHQTISFGGTTSLRVSAAGLAPFAYQWQCNGNDAPGDGSVLRITNATPEQAGSYSVRVSNASGSVTSSPVTLSLLGLDSDFAAPVANMQLKLAGITGAVYRVEFKADLDASGWTPLTNFTLPGSVFRFTDLSSSNAPQRFYRAFYLP